MDWSAWPKAGEVIVGGAAAGTAAVFSLTDQQLVAILLVILAFVCVGMIAHAIRA
jgi:hypothetical protein